MSLQGGWDRDSQAKKGGMAGLTGKMGGKAGSEKPIGDPQVWVVSDSCIFLAPPSRRY